jgi:alanine racemase
MGPTRAYINHSNLLHNYNLIKKAVAPAKVMCVVKANAYGHDSVAVSKTLVENGVEYLGVAFAEEGIELRKAGIDTPILVFGAQLADFLDDHLEYNLDITLTSEHQIQILTKLCREKNKIAKVHIKIDTGMNRVGFLVQ